MCSCGFRLLNNYGISIGRANLENCMRFPFSADEDLELKEFGLKVYVEYCFSVNLYLCRNIPRIVPGWKKRHMHLVGMPLVMQYRATEIQSIPGPRESLKWLFVPEDGEVPVELDVYNFKGPGRALAIFKDIFHEVYEKTWKQKFEENSIRVSREIYLITEEFIDAVARTLETKLQEPAVVLSGECYHLVRGYYLRKTSAMFVLHVLMSRHQRTASATQVSPRKKPLSSLDVD
ncbi:hypothetical protein NC651_000002 [Populus alba x Populus x berolinensis]|nr:hypothetical protein NC651_000002 [Populus alba x Populus x berolinensis]